MADTLSISPELSVTVYGYNGREILVEEPSQYASECRSRNKAVITAGVPSAPDVPEPGDPSNPSNPGDPSNPSTPVIPKSGDSSNPMLWAVLIVLSSMGFTACIICGKRKRNGEE